MTAPLKPDAEAGFSLIEALVALAILAISAGALITAAEHHVRRIGQVEARTGALWAARNHLAELEAGLSPADDAAAEIGGVSYAIRTERETTPDPAIEKITVRVSERERDGDLAVLSGFAPASEARR